MKSLNNPTRPLRHAVLASMALGVLPGAAAAAGAGDTDRAVRDIEMRLQQDEARRQMADRERMQQDALSAQRESIRRLEEAQRRLADNSREVAALSSELGRNYTYSFGASGMQPRALLGLSVAPGAERRGGAFVEQVSPGGAAEEAGIKAGDIITLLDGQDLSKEVNPGRAVVEKMRRVEPDTRLKVEVLRDGRKMNFEVTPRLGPGPAPVAPSAQAMLDQMRLRQDAAADVLRMREAGPPGALPLNGNAVGGMELATLSGRLGSYFGVSEGVLVVRAGAEGAYGLQDGDVILSIDGRAPSNAQHAGRILRSYQPGEKVTLHIQRDRKPTELATVAPGRRN